MNRNTGSDVEVQQLHVAALTHADEAGQFAILNVFLHSGVDANLEKVFTSHGGNDRECQDFQPL